LAELSAHLCTKAVLSKFEKAIDPFPMAGTWLAPVRFLFPKGFDAYPQFLGEFLPVFLHLNAPSDDLLANFPG
jgi:hypothetical protein